MPDKIHIQLTIVSHYGSKSPELSNLIIMLQDKLSKCFGFAFKPYDLEQVHGTIIGLEGIFDNNQIKNKWFKENNNEDRYMQTEELLKFIKSDEINEINIKLGGYLLHEDYGFKSRGQHPFTRSFTIQGPIAVAMGWPIKIVIENGNEKIEYTNDLYKLRNEFKRFGVLHKWHKNGYEDNDFFFVLGRIDSGVNPNVKEQTESEMRDILAAIDKRITINKDTMSVVAYVDPQLPTTTSEAFKFNDQSLTPDWINYLYGQSLEMRPTTEADPAELYCLSLKGAFHPPA